MEAVADYQIEGRVIALRSYHDTEDAMARLSPIDASIGWRNMSDPARLAKMHFNLLKRFLAFQPRDPATRFEADYHDLSNTHLIPQTVSTAAKLRRIRQGNVVKLTGQLVNVETAAGQIFPTSLTREDTGAGACEIMLVKTVEIEENQ